MREKKREIERNREKEREIERKRERKARNREKKREKERKGEKRREKERKDVQGQLLSICIQYAKRKFNILAEILEISKSGLRGSIYI